MDQVHSCVIGAGVVGLAIGRALAARGDEVFVLDQAHEFGTGISSRNSEVIHAGIYYPRDSLKARFCVEGKHRLYEYCAGRNIGHRRLGKVIVATSVEEEAVLEDILAKACANGVDDLEWWSGDTMKREEPAVKATRALFSPSSGIVSSHELMQAFLGDLERAGGTFVGGARITAVARAGAGFVLTCDIGGEPFRLAARRVVNAAGLGAQAIARCCDALDPAMVPPLYYAKGNYFTLAGKSPFDRLVYPVPEPSGAGLGVHATLDLGGQAKFGPDVRYVDDEDYDVDVDRREGFVAAIRRYFPDLDETRLSPGYVGIRPKLQGPGDTPADFMIQDWHDHGVAGLVNLFGIESPGLTSSMAIAEDVARRVSELDQA